MTRMTAQIRESFAEKLFDVIRQIEPALQELDLYEFEYGLNNLIPTGGWDSVVPEAAEALERRVNSRSFYDAIRIKPQIGGQIVMDEQIIALTNMLFVGLVRGDYNPDWVSTHFYFDVRGFYFLHRTEYFTEAVRAHLDCKPIGQFEQRQKQFERAQEIGYRAFREANEEVDRCFLQTTMGLIASRGAPVVLAIAGPTAAGKTEIVERFRYSLQEMGRRSTSIEMDNFLTDRDAREERGIFTQGKEALHFELFLQSLRDITGGKKIYIPRYDFVYATSSHDLTGRLKPGSVPIEIEPAEIVFVEGNFPFLIPEIAELIGLKVVYLTDDPIRLKRKWRRDIDYRKKYDPTYFRNRFFKDQFIMAEIAYRPQMTMCDLLVDTTGAAVWATEYTARMLSSQWNRTQP